MLSRRSGLEKHFALVFGQQKHFHIFDGLTFFVEKQSRLCLGICVTPPQGNDGFNRHRGVCHGRNRAVAFVTLHLPRADSVRGLRQICRRVTG